MDSTDRNPPALAVGRFKIIAMPCGTTNTASSRIRCFRFLSFMPEGVDRKIVKPINAHHLDGSILYFQKVAYPDIVELVKRYRAQGGHSVYDLDDDIGVWKGNDEIGMMAAVNAVTTDTEVRAEALRKLTNTPVHVVPDAIDYVDAQEPPVTIRDDMRRIVTFGDRHSCMIAAPVMALISSYDRHYIGEAPGIIPGAYFLRWSPDRFISNLRDHDVAVLVHEPDAAGNMKSNNRLLVSMSIGLPTIVSNTSAYAETMHKIGTDFLVLKDGNGINDILQQLKPREMRETISKVFIQYCWDNYAPQTSSLKLLEVFKSLTVPV